MKWQLLPIVMIVFVSGCYPAQKFEPPMEVPPSKPCTFRATSYESLEWEQRLNFNMPAEEIPNPVMLSTLDTEFFTETVEIVYENWVVMSYVNYGNVKTLFFECVDAEAFISSCNIVGYRQLHAGHRRYLIHQGHDEFFDRPHLLRERSLSDSREVRIVDGGLVLIEDREIWDQSVSALQCIEPKQFFAPYHELK